VGSYINSPSNVNGSSLSFLLWRLGKRKNLVSTLVQCIIIFAVVSLVWVFFGDIVSFMEKVSVES